MPLVSGVRLAFIALIVVSWLAPPPAAGQDREAAADPYVAPRTPDGRPDLQASGPWRPSRRWSAPSGSATARS